MTTNQTPSPEETFYRINGTLMRIASALEKNNDLLAGIAASLARQEK